MNDKILQTIIELTQQHDVDSLEISLITTLSEVIPATAIFLVKLSAEGNQDEYIEVMRLAIAPSAESKEKYTWIHENNICTGKTHVQECLQHRNPVHYKMDNGLTRFFFPISHNNSAVEALGIEANQDLTAWRSIIEAFVKIYGNYLTILHISERDKLTDLHNRRTFDDKLDKLLRTQRLQYEHYGNHSDKNEKRRTYPMAHTWLAMLDIDHFKRINDTYGHLFGDEVILIVAQQLRCFFRRSDLLFRFGGEEFVVILSPLSAELARQLLERFREAIARYKIPQIGLTTISIGYTKIIDGVSSHITLDHADKALYYAKEHGRNCTSSYEVLVANGHLSGQKKSSVTLFADDDPDAI